MKRTLISFASILLIAMALAWSTVLSPAAKASPDNASAMTIIALAPSTPAIALEGNPSATGHGAFQGGKGQLVTFSFNAVQHQDGYITGEAEIHDLNDDSSIHIEINCVAFGVLKGDVNFATLSGIIKNATDADLVGDIASFSVQDNGEGSQDPPDAISSLLIIPADKGCLNCQSVKPFSMSPTVKGNIQVRPGPPACPEGFLFCPALGRCFDPAQEKCPL